MGPFVFLDIETTGIEPNTDHIIEIACLKWSGGGITERFETLVNPRVPLPYEITLLTGIKDDMVKTAPLFSEVRQKILDFIGDAIVIGHNIAFDTAFLKSHHLELKNPEIDTMALAKILLPKESSYALEVLTKKYGLPVRSSHRAMADIETTADFFEFLLGKIAEIPEPAWPALEKILAKTDWAGKSVFNKNAKDCAAAIAKRKSAKGLCPLKSAVNKPGTKKFWGSGVIRKFLDGGKILLESAKEIPLHELKNQRVIIAYNSFRKRDELIETAREQKLPAVSIKEPGFYLSPAKLERAISEKEFFASDEAPIFLKITLWSSGTQTGDREELSLEREEYGYFDALADNDGADVYWTRALESTAESNIVLIHQYGLARGLGVQIAAATKAQKWNLIILEASNLEDSFTNAYRKRFTEAGARPFFSEKAAIAFGLLGIFYEHFAGPDEGGFKGNVILDNALRNSIQWRHALAAFENLPPCPKKEEILHSFAGQPNTVQWVNSFANEIGFHSAPLLIAGCFAHAVSPFKNILLQSPALSADGSFKFIREMLELDSTWNEIKEPAEPSDSSLEIKLKEKFPEPYASGYFKKCLHLFTEIIEAQKGRSLFLLSSKKAVQAMYQALLPKAEAAAVKLLGVGFSGGAGKSLALFLENPAGSILLSTNKILPHIRDIEDHIDVIVFQKIPFDPPDDPLLSSRAKQFANGFEEYTVPRAVIRFREILAEFGRGKPKTCWLLDSRLVSRDYGRLFI